MNWDMISTVAEAVGAAGVIITLIYLARQVREANQNVAIEANQQLGRDLASHGAVVMGDENVDALLKGLKSFSTLTPQEQVKFDNAVAVYVNFVEATLLHNEAGRIEDVRVMLGNYLGPRLFAYPGFEEWWLHGEKGGFGDYTQREIDLMIEKYRGTKGFWSI